MHYPFAKDGGGGGGVYNYIGWRGGAAGQGSAVRV